MRRSTITLVTAFVGTYVLPSAVGLTTSCFGKRFEVRIEGRRVVLALPDVEPGQEKQSPRLVAPAVENLPERRASGIRLRRDDPDWGQISAWNSATGQPTAGAWLAKVGLVTAFGDPLEYSDYLYGLGAPESPELAQFFESVDPWFERLLAWIAVVVDQDTHYREPLRSISVAGEGLTLQAVLGDGRISLPRSANRATITTARTEMVNLTTFRDLLKRTSNGEAPSDARLLLRDGYIDLRRDRLRKAVIDGGSAAESALATWCRTNNVRLPAKPTLGWFVQNSGAPIPLGSQTDLVDIRNDAIHNNITPARVEATRALAVSDLILNEIEPL